MADALITASLEETASPEEADCQRLYTTDYDVANYEGAMEVVFLT